MKAEIKAFNRRKPRPDTHELTARLDLRAQDDHDARKLAALYRCLFLGEFPYLRDAMLQAVGEMIK